jgi:hypothetical protein
VSTARLCNVPTPDGPCGYPVDGRAADCSAHRQRRQRHGDVLGHIRVRRLPTRKPDAVAERLARRVAEVAYAPVTDRPGNLEWAP